MHLFRKKDKITPKDTKKLYKTLIKHWSIPQTAAKNVIKLEYENWEKATCQKTPFLLVPLKCKNCGYEFGGSDPKKTQKSQDTTAKTPANTSTAQNAKK